MTFLEDMHDSVERLRVFGELEVDAAKLPVSAAGLSDDSVRDVIALTRALMDQATTLQAVMAGIASARSGRERGHSGFVQTTGHRTPVEFLRDTAGMTRGDAIRTVKVGESLLKSGISAPDAGASPPGPPGEPVPGPWHAPLDDALLAGIIRTAQHDAIRRGLGEPPTISGRTDDEVTAAWRSAANRLIGEAPACPIDELSARARTLRDMADPEGAEKRHQELFERRSYRCWTDEDGLRNARIRFDPEMGEWAEHTFRTALSPRRGGPRFVADDEKRQADLLERDPRSNEQLMYDLFVDLFRAGARAQHDDVYGAKEAGVRLMVMKDTVTGDTARRDAFGRLVATACTDDGHLVVPGSVLEHALCGRGAVEILTDTAGNPLDVGRELRLFSRKQRIALAARDGGCVWPGCDRPPEMCEAHHIDHWNDGGATDCDRGILLCRYHHLTLHNNGWRITRDGKGPFLLHPPPHLNAHPIVLTSKSPLRWLWDPPPDRVSWRQAA